MAVHGSGTAVPAPRTSLIGRTDELDTLRNLILHADERLLTLTGVGGCGKTRLAMQLATDLAPSFPHRLWLVELAPVADPALLPIAVASALGLREEAGRFIRGSPLELPCARNPRSSCSTTASI